MLNNRSNQSGNVFTLLIGAVALVGVISVASMNMLSGPVATSSRVMQKTMADSQMFANSKIVLLSATNQANAGDCDADGFIEPEPWRDAAGNGPDGVAGSNGGGFVPTTLGLTATDPWGTEYGYCVWDVGTVDDAGCGGNTQLRLQGSPTPTVGNSDTQYVSALISAGQDRIFQTGCKNYVNGTTSIMTQAGDDIVHKYTYSEASAAGSSLWTIDVTDATTATIDKKIDLNKGFKMGSSTEVTTCAGIQDAEQMRYNPISGAIEVCDGISAWVDLAGGGGVASSFDDNNTVVCDGTTQGQIRYNTTSQLPEFCNGTGWIPFTFSSSFVELVLTPSNSSGMDVTGPCVGGDCPFVYGPEVIFTLQNVGTTTSNPVVYTITGDTANFIDQGTSNCSGVALATNDSCEIRIKAKADGNFIYSGALKITTDNQPLSTLSGTGSAFGCFVGASAPGGVYASCGMAGGYDLVVTPGGCSTTTFNPTCSGTDYTLYTWGSTGDFSTLYDYNNGAQNNANSGQYIAIGAGSFPAIEYCLNLTYGGFSDWYLPARNEFRDSIMVNKTAIGGFSGWYWSSTAYSSVSNIAERLHSNGTSIGTDYRWNTQKIRCARRDNIPLPAPQIDSDPDDIGLSTTDIIYTASTRQSSAVKTIKGITTSISVSVAGAGNPTFKINGGAEITTGTMNYNDTIQWFMDSPAVLGTKQASTLTVGPDTYTWNIGYADSSITRRIFATSATYRGDLGGVGGADLKCNSLAMADIAGLGGTWKAVLSESSENNWAVNRAPWNWGTLKNINNDVVANSFNDLWTGSLVSPVGYDEKGVSVGTALIWTATNSTGQFWTSSASKDCLDWTTASSLSSYSSKQGSASSSSGAWMESASSNDCSKYFRIYCLEEDPLPAYVTPVNPKSCTMARDINAMPIGGTIGVDEGTTGEYTIDPDDTGALPPMQVYCDMDTAGGPWMLVLNYVHQGTTNPALAPSGTTFPVLSATGGVLGDDESAIPTSWGHGTPGLINNFYNNGNFSRIRFECSTSRHGRQMNFYSTHGDCINYARIGGFSGVECYHVKLSPTLLTGHSANLPNSANTRYQNQGSNALTYFPFYRSGVAYWGIGAQTDEWACDGMNDTNAAFDTIHRVWIK